MNTQLRSQLIHERAEEILAAALGRQGRRPDAYTTDEYVVAIDQAERELSARRAPPRIGEMDRLATRTRDGWVIDGKLIGDDGALLAHIQAERAREEENARVMRELGIAS